MKHLYLFPSTVAGFFALLTLPEPTYGAPGGARQARMRGLSYRPTTYDFKNICGIPGVRPTYDYTPTFKILNGTCDPYGAHPWMAQIQAKLGSDHKHHCGGTILTDDIILTAAHCFQTVRPSRMRVVVGQGLLSSQDDEEMVFDIEDAIIHPRWDTPIDGRFSNDVALIKLRRKGDGSGIQFTDRVAPACLPTFDTPQKSGTECVISGWGKTDADATEDTDCLKSAAVPIIDNQECQDMYDESHRSIIKGMMCAGYAQGGTDACSADSGGPLTCKIEGKFVINGIVSWGDGCGKPNRPGVYTNVKHYMEWIEEIISSL